MVLGFNHNLMYKGEVFHVQTEDSGVANPHIITLLYRGGVIISSKKTSYSDILKMDNLEVVVEELMKEQHKDMLRRLKSGEFDSKAFGTAPPKKSESASVTPKETPTPALPQAPEPDNTGIDILFQETVLTDTTPPTNQQSKEDVLEKKQGAVSLDDAILNFFGASK